MQQLPLSARSLVKHYGNVASVDGIDLSLQEGECLALLGPNGAGKTTTCEILEGLIVPDSGHLELWGLEYDKNRPEILEKIGVQLQETTLYKKYTVRETLQLFASFYRHSDDVDPLIARLQLTDKAGVRLEKLSGGQKQRVYIGCALVHNPALVFLDEPTSGLDPQARMLIWEMVRELKSAKRAFLLTTHHMEEAVALADRIAIMDQGKIIAQGTLEDLVADYPDVLTFATTAEGFQRLNTAAALPWLAGALPDARGQVERAVPCATGAVADLVRAADVLGVTLTALKLRKATLEDVFLQKTGRQIRQGSEGENS